MSIAQGDEILEIMEATPDAFEGGDPYEIPPSTPYQIFSDFDPDKIPF